MTILPSPEEASRVTRFLQDHPRWSAYWDKMPRRMARRRRRPRLRPLRRKQRRGHRYRLHHRPRL